MKGIILAGGNGTRLYPMTASISKQVLPVYDKPMIYYPLSLLMEIGIKEILIIVSPRDISLYKNLLSSGNQFGINLTYKIQHNPNGIAEALIIGSDFIGNSKCSLVLGDNIFLGDMKNELKSINFEDLKGASIFGYEVEDPERYGIVSFNEEGKVDRIEEKPINPNSKYAVPGFYIYDNNVVNYAKKILPSSRGELEITDINKQYLNRNELRVNILGSSITWLDAGTPESLYEASSIVKGIQKRTGKKIACLEEIAFKNEWISCDDLKAITDGNSHTEYGEYLKKMLDDYKKNN